MISSIQLMDNIVNITLDKQDDSLLWHGPFTMHSALVSVFHSYKAGQLFIMTVEETIVLYLCKRSTIICMETTPLSMANDGLAMGPYPYMDFTHHQYMYVI